MADVQLENGYAKIANEILESMAKFSINGTQHRIIDVIWRYTYGFNRKDHGLSEAFISKATDIHKKQIQRELNELIAFKVIKVVKDATFNSSRVLAFNKDYSEWVVTKKLPGSKKEDTTNMLPDNPIDTHTGSEIVPSPGSELATQEINNIKKTIKKDIVPFSEIQDLFNTICVSLPRVQKLTISRKEKLSKRWAEMPDINDWKQLFTIVQRTPFLVGKNDRGWKASFDWLIRNDTNIVGVLEGKYGNKSIDQDKFQNIIT